ERPSSSAQEREGLAAEHEYAASFGQPGSADEARGALRFSTCPRQTKPATTAVNARPHRVTEGPRNQNQAEVTLHSAAGRTAVSAAANDDPGASHDLQRQQRAPRQRHEQETSERR